MNPGRSLGQARRLKALIAAVQSSLQNVDTDTDPKIAQPIFEGMTGLLEAAEVAADCLINDLQQLRAKEGGK